MWNQFNIIERFFFTLQMACLVLFCYCYIRAIIEIFKKKFK
jgi:hypothetical protein